VEGTTWNTRARGREGAGVGTTTHTVQHPFEHEPKNLASPPTTRSIADDPPNDAYFECTKVFGGEKGTRVGVGSLEWWKGIVFLDGFGPKNIEGFKLKGSSSHGWDKCCPEL
jgi:hypothetical protein